MLLRVFLFIYRVLLFQLSDNTFKNYYYPEAKVDDDSSDEEGTVGLKLKQAIAKKRAAAMNNSIDGFFEHPRKKAKVLKRCSTVSRSTTDGVAYLSSSTDDGAYASHIIKIEIYDVQKIKNIAPTEHWKHADVRLKHYTTTEDDKQYQSARDLIYNITKDIAEKENSVKYFIDTKK